MYQKNKMPRKKNSKKPPVNPDDIRLVKGKGSPGRGGGEGGAYWHIYLTEKRVGYVFINVIDEEIIGQHASIQIHLNQNHRGKKIGRIAYKRACENSEHDKVYAHMRKSNIASKKAAEKAGFNVIEDVRVSQLVLVWLRHT